MQGSAIPRKRSASPPHDQHGMGGESAHGAPLLRALSALLFTERDEKPLPRLFPPLHAMFDFDQAFALEHHEDFLQCIAAMPDASIGRRVSVSPLWTEVAAGRGGLVALNEGREELHDLLDQRSAHAQSALFLPIGLRR